MLTKSDAYCVGYSIAMFENIIAHLGSAAIQRAPNDDKIIADHIDAALESAKNGLHTLTVAQNAAGTMTAQPSHSGGLS